MARNITTPVLCPPIFVDRDGSSYGVTYDECDTGYPPAFIDVIVVSPDWSCDLTLTGIFYDTGNLVDLEDYASSSEELKFLKALESSKELFLFVVERLHYFYAEYMENFRFHLADNPRIMVKVAE